MSGYVVRGAAGTGEAVGTQWRPPWVSTCPEWGRSITGGEETLQQKMAHVTFWTPLSRRT